MKFMIKNCGFNNLLYGTHSLHARRTCNLHQLGLSIESIKKLGRWKSNAVFRYLKELIISLSNCSYVYSYFLDTIPMMHDLWIVGNKFLDDIQHELARLQRVCYLGKRHSGTLVIKYPLLCNVSLNIRVKQ